MYTSPPQGAMLQPGFGSKPFSEASPIDLLLCNDLEPGQQVHEKTRLRSSFGFNTCRTLAHFFKRHLDHLSVAPASGQATMSPRPAVATSTSRADRKLGNGKTVEAKSARQSKSWPIRRRFWIGRQRTETVQRRLNRRSLRSLSTKATTPSRSREARRLIKKSDKSDRHLNPT